MKTTYTLWQQKLQEQTKYTLAESEETSQKRVDITSVNEGRNYIYDEDAVAEIGWIWATEIWDDVTVPGNLLRKGNARLAELTEGITSMELTIVDESDTGADIGDIRARMYVKCLSAPHGINGTYLCVSRDRDYLNPAGNTITIGASGVTLTSATARQSQTITALETDMGGIVGRVEEISASKMYRTELVVDGVNIFRDKGQQSVIHCKVFSWDKDITDGLAASSFVWHRHSNDSDADEEWDSAHTGTKTITVSTEDVQDNASFFCEVTI